MGSILGRGRWMRCSRVVGAWCTLLAGWFATPASGQALVRPESHPAGILIVVTDNSGLVSNDSPLYVASNVVGWNPGDPSMKLSGRSDLRWQIMLPGPVGGTSVAGDARFEFKLTRGSWETCEVAADLSDISNRGFAPVDPSELKVNEPYVVELTVERFADEREGAPKPQFRADSTRPLDVTGDAFRLQVVGGAGAATGAMRDVTVWLPPGYGDPVNAERRYPVLYMQDGQHVFETSPPTPDEWRADETATALIEAGEIEPIIIVSVPNSAGNRASEYLPGTAGALAQAIDAEPEGDAYLAWLIREVVPRVERAVRASADPADRGIGGASLGGLLALRAGTLHPDVFGRVLAESPTVHFRGQPVAFLEDGPWRPRTFIGIGDREMTRSEDGTPVAMSGLVAKQASLLMGRSGADRSDAVTVVIGQDAEHNEAAWAERFDEALRHLYPPVSD